MDGGWRSVIWSLGVISELLGTWREVLKRPSHPQMLCPVQLHLPSGTPLSLGSPGAACLLEIQNTHLGICNPGWTRVVPQGTVCGEESNGSAGRQTHRVGLTL